MGILSYGTNTAIRSEAIDQITLDKNRNDTNKENKGALTLTALFRNGKVATYDLSHMNWTENQIDTFLKIVPITTVLQSLYMKQDSSIEDILHDLYDKMYKGFYSQQEDT